MHPIAVSPFKMDTGGEQTSWSNQGCEHSSGSLQPGKHPRPGHCLGTFSYIILFQSLPGERQYFSLIWKYKNPFRFPLRSYFSSFLLLFTYHFGSFLLCCAYSRSCWIQAALACLKCELIYIYIAQKKSNSLHLTKYAMLLAKLPPIGSESTQSVLLIQQLSGYAESHL